MNIRNNDGNYEIDHDQGTEDDETNEETHCEDEGESVLILS